MWSNIVRYCTNNYRNWGVIMAPHCTNFIFLLCKILLLHSINFGVLTFQGKFSTKSDVWSFGVTLWEVLSFAREQPYESLSDEQVIENCGHYYRNDGLEVCLPQPANCPREIYDLMRECWNRDEVQRPAFREIHMFMQRKNMGYDPKIEQTYSPLV